MKDPFFIIGSGRSGTTVLRLMLNMHREIRVPRESGFLIPLMEALPCDRGLSDRELESAFEIVRRHGRWPDWECSDEKLRQAIFAEPQSSLAAVIDRIFRACSGMGSKTWWGDKTPKYSLVVPSLAALFPSSKFIHLIRDARDVYVSMRNAGWFEKTPRRISWYWTGMTLDAMKGRNLAAGRYLEVHYESLVAKPEEELRRICNFLGTEFEMGMLHFYDTASQETAPWEKKLHSKTNRPAETDRIACWRKEMSLCELYILEAYARSTMTKIGQKPALPIWTLPLQSMVKAGLESRHRFEIFCGKVRNRLQGRSQV